MHSFRFEIEDTELGALREDWQRLFRKSSGSPFTSWEWASTWFKWFGESRRPHVIKAIRNGETVALLPLFSEKARVLGMSFTRLGLIGESVGGADYLGVVCADEHLSEVSAELFAFLDESGTQGILSLDAIDSESVLAEAALARGGRVKRSSVCPVIDLSMGWDAVLKDSRRRVNFGRRLRQLERSEGFGFRAVEDPSEISEAFERFYALHEARWLASGGSELTGHPRLAAFHREAVLALGAAGFVRFDEVWSDGECRASAYMMERAGTRYLFNSAYDPAWADRSVGLVLLGLSIRSAAERGLACYDFLRGSEGYKFDWSNGRRELVSVSVPRRSLPAAALILGDGLSSAAKRFADRILPAPVAERLRARKRGLARGRLSAVSSEA